MPTFKFTHQETGRKFRITGERPPSERELNQIFMRDSQRRIAAEGPGLAGLGSKLHDGIYRGLETPERMIRNLGDATGYYKGLDYLFGTGDRFQKYNQEALDNMRRWEQDRRQFNEQIGANTFAGEVVQGVGKAIAELPMQILPASKAATTAGAVKASAAIAGSQSGLETYGNVRGEGGDRGYATIRGLEAAVITALTTKAFGASGVESVFRKSGAKGVAQKLGETFKQAGMEAGEEILDEFQQDLAKRYHEDPTRPIGETVEELLLAGTVGGLVGGLVSAAGEFRNDRVTRGQGGKVTGHHVRPVDDNIIRDADGTEMIRLPIEHPEGGAPVGDMGSDAFPVYENTVSPRAGESRPARTAVGRADEGTSETPGETESAPSRPAEHPEGGEPVGDPGTFPMPDSVLRELEKATVKESLPVAGEGKMGRQGEGVKGWDAVVPGSTVEVEFETVDGEQRTEQVTVQDSQGHKWFQAANGETLLVSGPMDEGRAKLVKVVKEAAPKAEVQTQEPEVVHLADRYKEELEKLMQAKADADALRDDAAAADAEAEEAEFDTDVPIYRQQADDLRRKAQEVEDKAQQQVDEVLRDESYIRNSRAVAEVVVDQGDRWPALRVVKELGLLEAEPGDSLVPRLMDFYALSQADISNTPTKAIKAALQSHKFPGHSKLTSRAKMVDGIKKRAEQELAELKTELEGGPKATLGADKAENSTSEKPAPDSAPTPKSGASAGQKRKPATQKIGDDQTIYVEVIEPAPSSKPATTAETGSESVESASPDTSSSAPSVTPEDPGQIFEVQAQLREAERRWAKLDEQAKPLRTGMAQLESKIFPKRKPRFGPRTYKQSARRRDVNQYEELKYELGKLEDAAGLIIRGEIDPLKREVERLELQATTTDPGKTEMQRVLARKWLAEGEGNEHAKELAQADFNKLVDPIIRRFIPDVTEAELKELRVGMESHAHKKIEDIEVGFRLDPALQVQAGRKRELQDYNFKAFQGGFSWPDHELQQEYVAAVRHDANLSIARMEELKRVIDEQSQKAKEQKEQRDKEYREEQERQANERTAKTLHALRTGEKPEEVLSEGDVPAEAVAIDPTEAKAPGKSKSVFAALKEIVSRDPSRWLLGGIHVTDGEVVATDGRLLVVSPYDGELENGTYKVKTKAGETEGQVLEGQYPNYRLVMDSAEENLKGGVRSPKGGTAGTIKVSGELYNRVKHAAKVNKFFGRDKSGFSGVFHTGSGSIGVSPELLRRAIDALYKLGGKNLQIHLSRDPLNPVVIRSQYAQLKAVLMPMRMMGPKEAKLGAHYELGSVKGARSPKGSKGSKYTTAQKYPGGELGGKGGPLPVADDPEHTVFPFQMPELVRITRALGQGKFPRLKHLLKMGALGVFRAKHGKPDSGSIFLDKSLWRLITEAEIAELKAEAAELAPDDAKEQRRIFEELYEQLYQEKLKSEPERAVKVLAHELMHWIDFLPQGIIDGRGNIFGRVAKLKKYLKHTIPWDPYAGLTGFLRKPTKVDREKLRRQAKKEMRDELGPIREIVRQIVVEEPIYETVGVSPEDIKALFGMSAREDMPELYVWFARLDDKTKKEVVKQAMKGAVDARAPGTKKKVGTKRTERTVREKVGREPTKEEIQARFQEKLRAELDRLRQMDIKEIKAQLEGAIAWWRGTPEMEDYFASSEEMFAEAGSIFLANPAALAKRAPKYFKALINYMDRNPAVARLYDEIQQQIAEGGIDDQRSKDMRAGWQAQEERAIAKQSSGRWTISGAIDSMIAHLDRALGPVYRRARGSKREGDLRARLGMFNYRGGPAEAYVNAVDVDVSRYLVGHNLSWEDFGEFLFHKRVTEHYDEKAVPLGYSPATSQDALRALAERVGAVRYAALEEAQRRFRKIYVEDVIGPMERAGMLDERLRQVLHDNIYYATWEAVKDAPKTVIEELLDQRFGSGVSSHVYRRVGNLGEIKNPATATINKALAMISAAHRNNAKRILPGVLEEMGYPVQEVKKTWDPSRKALVYDLTPEQKGSPLQKLVFINQGKIRAFYVEKEVAEAFNSGSPIEGDFLAQQLRNLTRVQKQLFTGWNYGFWPVMTARDVIGAMVQLPGFLSPLHYVKNLPASVKAAADSYRGRRNPDAEAALKRGMWISRSEPTGFAAESDNEFELKTARMGLTPGSWNKKDWRQWVGKLWEAYTAIGKIAERSHKINGMLYLDKQFPNMPEWEKAEAVREWAGSPDFLQQPSHQGKLDLFTNVFLMFYNPWKESLRSVAKAAKKHPASFTAKASLAVLTPTLIQGLAALGAFGDDWEEALKSVSDYDLQNYLIIPVGWEDEENKKLEYWRLPLWEPARLVHGAIVSSLTGRGKGADVLFYDQLPSVNPVWQALAAWMQYAADINPRDSHLDRAIIDQDLFDAADGRDKLELLKWTWNKVSGGVFGRFQLQSLYDNPTDKEKFLRKPIVQNSLGRLVKVSNRGIFDRDKRELDKPEQKRRAVIRLAVDQMIKEVLIEGKPATATERELVLREPYALEYFMDKGGEVLKGRSGLFAERMRRAQTKAARDAILMEELAGVAP